MPYGGTRPAHGPGRAVRTRVRPGRGTPGTPDTPGTPWRGSDNTGQGELNQRA